MKRRIPLNIPAETPEVIDHQAVTLNSILARIPDPTTFRELGGILRKSSEWVRLRIVADPRLFKFNGRYSVPKGVADELAKMLYGHPN